MRIRLVLQRWTLTQGKLDTTATIGLMKHDTDENRGKHSSSAVVTGPETVRSSNPDTAFDSHHHGSNLVRPPGPCQLRPVLCDVYTISSLGIPTSIQAISPKNLSLSPLLWMDVLPADRSLVESPTSSALGSVKTPARLEFGTYYHSHRVVHPLHSSHTYPMLPTKQSHTHRTKATTHHVHKQQWLPKCHESQRARSILQNKMQDDGR